jgi:hypothetical protein
MFDGVMVAARASVLVVMVTAITGIVVVMVAARARLFIASVMVFTTGTHRLG